MALPTLANSPSPVMELPARPQTVSQIVPPTLSPFTGWMRVPPVMVLPSATPSIVPLVMALPGPCLHSPTPPPRVCLDTGVSAFPSHATPFLSHPLPSPAASPGPTPPLHNAPTGPSPCPSFCGPLLTFHPAMFFLYGMLIIGCRRGPAPGHRGMDRTDTVPNRPGVVEGPARSRSRKA
jgi:hypothetical protein